MVRTKKPRSLGVFLIVLLMVSVAALGGLFAEGDTTATPDLIIESHKATEDDIEILKKIFGVYDPSVDYKALIDGYATGARSLTEEEWNEMAGQISIVDSIQLVGARAPASIDYSTTKWFPPIGDQGAENSCVCFAFGYYVTTFQEAKEHDWDLSGASWVGGAPSVAYQDKIFSPDFIYHQINDGGNNYTFYADAANLISSIGACSWQEMPYDPTDSTTWPSESAWREAPLYRGQGGYQWMDLTAGVDSLKNLLAGGNLAVLNIDASQYSGLTPNDVWTLDNYTGGGGHANTVVGYDDTFSYTEGGVPCTGAFKVANSWGVGGWENVNDGFYWISYAAMAQREKGCMILGNRINYNPQIISVFQMNHNSRTECDITFGKGDIASPTQTKDFAPWIQEGGTQPFPANKMVLDITEFTTLDECIFLEVYDGGGPTTGSLDFFSLERYTTYNPNGIADEVVISVNPPINTIQGISVYDFMYACTPPPSAPNSVDLIFVIDVTGSMWDDIDAVKASAADIVDHVSALTSDFRMGIVAYRDHPIPPYGNPGDPMFEDYAFSSDKATIINNINALTVYGGADWPEAVYDALLRAIDSSSVGGWRNGVKKILILMGDAPPHDPCPINGYTLNDVTTAAFNVDPAHVYSVCIGDDTDASDAFRAISKGTGGEVFFAATADDVIDILLEALRVAILGRPPPPSVQSPPPDYNEMTHPLALENIKKAKDLQAEVDNLVEDITDQGKEIPEEVKTLIDLAQTHLEKAEDYYAAGNYIAANYWAIRAQELFKEVIQALKDLNFYFFFFSL